MATGWEHSAFSDWILDDFFGIEFVIRNKVSLFGYQMEEMLHQFVKKDPSLQCSINK